MSTVIELGERRGAGGSGGPVERWIDQVLGPNFQYRAAECWRPSINLCEHEDHFCMVVELSGVKAEEIDLRVDEGLLILSGERKVPMEPEQPGRSSIRLMEIDHGRFERSVRLPGNVLVDEIEAFYRNGYLWVRIPKRTS